MRFLTKIGKLILKGTRYIVGISSTVQRVSPDGRVETFVDKLLEIRDVIIKLEAVGQALHLTGVNKLKGAAALVAQVILGSGVMINRKIGNEAMFLQGATKMADGMADVLNSLKDDNIETENHG